MINKTSPLIKAGTPSAPLNKSKRLVLGVTMDDKRLYLDLDLIDTISIDLNSIVSTYPLVEGDSISDHMYREPASISISGTFSSQGRFATNQNNDERLKDIQTLFERIKDERLFVDILSLYNIRQNYVLYKIAWTEKANTLDYSFSFKQIYTARVEELTYETDKSDSDLPILGDLIAQDLTDTLVDWSQIDILVAKAMIDAGMISEEFFRNFGTGYGVMAGGSVILGIGVAIAAVSTVPVAGWIIGATAVVGLGIYLMIMSAKKENERKNTAKEIFKVYEDERQMQAEYTRFEDFVNNIHTQLEVIETAAKVYSIPSDEKSNIETVLNLGNTNYILSFEKNNTTGFWTMKIKDVEGNILKELNAMMGIRSINDCTNLNIVFTSDNGTKIYLINPSLIEADENRDWDDMKYYKLGNFFLFITKVDMTKWRQMLFDIIKDALLM